MSTVLVSDSVKRAGTEEIPLYRSELIVMILLVIIFGGTNL